MRWILSLLLLGGCATAINGTTQRVSVLSEPTGASCSVRRAQAILSYGQPAPIELAAQRGPIPIDVSCSLAGHLDASRSFAPRNTHVGLANVLAGGTIGVAFDAATGANFAYPRTMRVRMTPVHFPTGEAHNAFFDADRATLRTEHAERIAPYEHPLTCETLGAEICGIKIAEVNAWLTIAMAEVDDRVGRTTVANR